MGRYRPHWTDVLVSGRDYATIEPEALARNGAGIGDCVEMGGVRLRVVAYNAYDEVFVGEVLGGTPTLAGVHGGPPGG